MVGVVDSIRRVTDIVGEFSAASSEQSSGVAQVGEAVTQMDSATQQNAALVEQMAAAASSLNIQAADLVNTVAVFQLAPHDEDTAKVSQHKHSNALASMNRKAAGAVRKGAPRADHVRVSATSRLPEKSDIQQSETQANARQGALTAVNSARLSPDSQTGASTARPGVRTTQKSARDDNEDEWESF